MSHKPPLLILAVIGATGAGKSALADLAVSHYGFTRYKFAGPLKDMLKALGATEQDMNGSQEHRSKPVDLLCGKSWRYAMQTLGTEWRNIIGKELWSRIAARRILESYEMGLHRFVIDDLRFLHEIEALNQFNPIVVAVRRPSVEPSKHDLRVYRATKSLPLSVRQLAARLLRAKFVHPSEGEWYGIIEHFKIKNTRSLGFLTEQCHAILGGITDYQSRQVDA